MWITIIDVLISAAHIFKISEGSDVESVVAFDRKGPIGHDILRSNGELGNIKSCLRIHSCHNACHSTILGL
jgi:hypothetical protein